MRRERNLYSQPGSERRPTTQSDRSREPFDVPTDGGTSPARAAPETERPEVTIDEVLSRLVIHDDRPIENLPTMTAPELKLIGRCVSLSTRQTIDGTTSTYYYTGLVAAVTSAAVTLMYVNRYSETDFEQYKERERAAAQPVDGGTAAEMTEHAHNRTASAEIDQDQNQATVSEYSYPTVNRRKATQLEEGERRAMQNAGSLAPAVAMTMKTAAGEKAAFAEAAVDGEAERDGAVVGSTQALRPPHFRRCAGSVGPLPYVSFLRKSIHDVSFGRDPRSSFYSLFSDPEKRLLDMQFLRMFVRRYLVHTSEGNNPRQVPLYAFVTVRGACPDLDRGLVNELVHEELPVLMKADEGIKKDKKRDRRRAERRDAAVQEEPLPGLFSNTGVLYRTGVPRWTFVAGVAVVMLAMFFAIFMGISLTMHVDPFISEYIVRNLSFFLGSLIVWVISGICTGQHAVAMHIPLSENRTLLVMRLLLHAGTVACCVMTIVVISLLFSPARMHTAFLERDADFLCNYYQRNRCSGFKESCYLAVAPFTDPLCNTCAVGTTYTRPCFDRIKYKVSRVLVPLILFTVLIFISTCGAVVQFVRLWFKVRSIAGRVEL